MLRLRLPTGEEVSFRSPEELAQEVRRGTVTAEATIFHAKSERWLPVSSHPVFRRALEGPMASASRPLIDELPDTAPTALMAPPPLYAEPRRQSARGGEGVGRPADARSDGLVLLLATLLVAIVVYLAVTRPAVPTGADSPQSAASGLAWTSIAAPGTLARHHMERERRMLGELETRLKASGTPHALLPDGATTPQILDQAVATLREARDTIAVYRRRSAVLDQAYSDSSGRVGQNDAPPSAPIVAAQDSLYALAQALVQVLVAERGRFHSTTDTVSFERPAPAAEYERLRLALTGQSAQLRTSPRTARLIDPLASLPAAAR